MGERMHANSMILMAYFKNKYLSDMSEASILDIGSRIVKGGRQESYKNLFPPPYKYVGMDIVPGRNVDIVGYHNIKSIFEVVISGQTIEHVLFPWEWVRDLKKYFNKYICIIAPNRSKEHKYPVDTFRYFPDGMKALFKWAGITEIEIFKEATDTIGIGTKVN